MKIPIAVAFIVLLIGSEHCSAFVLKPTGTHNLNVLRARPTKVLDVDIIPSTPTKRIQQASPKPSLAPASVSKEVPVATLSESDEREKFIILGLLWFTACLASLDRVAMSVAFLPMSTEFMFSSTVKGTISSFFSIGYGLLILPAGLLVGNISPKLAMMCGIALWSIATLATPFTAGVAMTSLLVARACVGGGESMVLPSTQRFLTVWTTQEEKSRALAFILSGFSCGKIGAYLLSPWIMEAFGGWRSLFFAYGLLGTALLIPWLLFARDEPSSIAALGSAEEPSKVDAGPGPMEEATRVFQEAPWLEMLQSKGVWGMTLAHCSKNWGLYNWLSWMPTFFSEQYHIGVKDSAWLSVVPGLAGIAGGVVAGIAADRAIQSMQDPGDDVEKTRIRNVFQSVGLLGPALVMALMAWHLPEQSFVGQAGLAAVFGMQAFNTGGFEAAPQEKAGPRWAGLLYSVSSLPGVLIGTFGVWFTGVILDATGQNWSLIFAINSAVNIVGAAAFVALYDSTKEFD